MKFTIYVKYLSHALRANQQRTESRISYIYRRTTQLPDLNIGPKRLKKRKKS